MGEGVAGAVIWSVYYRATPKSDRHLTAHFSHSVNSIDSLISSNFRVQSLSNTVIDG